MPEPKGETPVKRQEIVSKALDRIDQKEDEKLNEQLLSKINNKEESLKTFIQSNEDNKEKREAFYDAVKKTANEYGIAYQQILGWIFEQEIQAQTAILTKGDDKYSFSEIKGGKKPSLEKVKAIKNILTYLGFDPGNLIDQAEGHYGGPGGKVKKFGKDGVDKESETRLAVRQLQDFLNNQDLDQKVKKLRVDGLFGNKTYAALEAFLESIKVVSDQPDKADNQQEKTKEQLAQERFDTFKISAGTGISIRPLEVQENKVIAKITYKNDTITTSGKFLISQNSIESTDPNNRDTPFAIEQNKIVYKDTKPRTELTEKEKTPQEIFDSYHLTLGSGISLSHLSLDQSGRLKGKLTYTDPKDKSVTSVEYFIFQDHLERTQGSNIVIFDIKDGTIVYALGSNEAASNAPLNAPPNPPLSSIAESLPIQQNNEIVEKVKSTWINASKNPQQLQKEIPELFKKDGQGQITQNIIEREDANASYRLISREGNKIIVEFDNNQNNIPEGYDTIINGQFQSSIKYNNYDDALEAVIRGEIITNEEKNILASKYKNYYVATNETEQQLSRDYNFYENNPVMKRANELYPDFDAIRDNVDLTMDLSGGRNTKYNLNRLLESNKKLNKTSEKSPWKSDKSFLKSLTGYVGREEFLAKNNIQTFQDFITYRDKIIDQATRKIRDEEKPAQDIQPIAADWSDKSNLAQFNQLSNQNSIEKDRYYRLVEEKNNQSIIEFSKLKNKVPDGYVILENGKIQKKESYENYHIALQTAEKYNILTPEEKNLLETKYGSYEKAERDYHFYINNPAVEHAYSEWQSYRKIIETLFALDDLENKNGTIDNLRAKAKDKLRLLTTIGSSSVWQDAHLFQEIQEKEILLIPKRYLKDKKISSLPELIKHGSGLFEPQAEKPNNLPEGLVPQVRNIDQIRDRANQYSPQTELIQWDTNKDVFVVDFTNLKEQGTAMNRLAAFIEKKDAPKDRVLHDRELQDYIRSHNNANPDVFYVGHDYKADDLVRFFNTARQNQITLNPQEVILQQTLLRNGFMREENGTLKMQEPLKALVTFPENQNDNPQTSENEKIDQDYRELVLNHELSHGVLFTSKEYADYCRDFWNNMTSDLKTFFTDFLQKSDYDPANEYLTINEMQAYLLTQNWEKQNLNPNMLNNILNAKKDFLKKLPRNLRAKIPHIAITDTENTNETQQNKYGPLLETIGQLNNGPERKGQFSDPELQELQEKTESVWFGFDNTLNLINTLEDLLLYTGDTTPEKLEKYRERLTINPKSSSLASHYNVNELVKTLNQRPNLAPRFKTFCKTMIDQGFFRYDAAQKKYTFETDTDLIFTAGDNWNGTARHELVHSVFHDEMAGDKQEQFIETVRQKFREYSDQNKVILITHMHPLYTDHLKYPSGHDASEYYQKTLAGYNKDNQPVYQDVFQIEKYYTDWGGQRTIRFINGTTETGETHENVFLNEFWAYTHDGDNDIPEISEDISQNLTRCLLPGSGVILENASNTTEA